MAETKLRLDEQARAATATAEGPLKLPQRQFFTATGATTGETFVLTYAPNPDSMTVFRNGIFHCSLEYTLDSTSIIMTGYTKAGDVVQALYIPS